MLRKTFFAVLAVLAAATASQAALVLQQSAGTPLALGGLVSYTVSALGTAGEQINTFTNPVITAAVGSAGIHNVWQGAAPPGASTPTEEQQSGIWDPSWAAYDSYFLFHNSDYTLNLGPEFTETNDATTNATVGAALPKFAAVFPPSATGFGTYGSDALSTKVLGTPGNNVAFFQVVMNAADAALMSLRLDGRDTNQNPVFNVISDFCIGMCEPTGQFEVNDLFLGGALPGANIVGGPLSTNATVADIAWSLVSLVGPDGAEAGASVDPATGVFSWQSAPTDSRGAYMATIQGVNSGDPTGTDTGVLSFNLVPEPASITLLGLALFGAFGFIRRR